MFKAAHKEVTTKFFHTGSEEEPFRFACGESLPGITVAYETYGKLNATKSNARSRMKARFCWVGVMCRSTAKTSVSP